MERKVQVDLDVIGALEKLLRMARDGEVHGFACLYNDGRGRNSQWHVGTDCGAPMPSIYDFARQFSAASETATRQ